MPRRLPGVLILLLVSVTIGRAQGDAVLFTAGADAVTRSEFEYHWRRSSEKRLDVFLQAYGRFKQKIQYAKELGLDTLAGFRLQREYLRKQLCQEKERTSSGKQEWIRLVHVTCPLSQQSDKKQALASEARLDSLYRSWKNGEEIHAAPLPWIQTRHLLDEWQKQLKGLDKGEFSRPFYSPQGIHLIAWMDKRVGSPIKNQVAEADGSFRIREVEEGLLVAALDTYVEQRLDCTDEELERYFKHHRSDYGWGTPHFQGAVIHCQDKKEAKRIKKYLKKYPEELWLEARERMPEHVSKDCLMEIGLFAIGKSPYVDKLVFQCGDFQALDTHPYTWVLGKKLKKGPTDMKTVRKKVYRDCKKHKKEAEMEAIMQKNGLEIDEEVLKTVNREGNK